jgi:hypothetical protein
MIDEMVLLRMSITRKAVELGLSERAENNIKVRQPLAVSCVSGPASMVGFFEEESQFVDLYLDEVNIKKMTIEKKGEELGVKTDTNLTDELKEEGILRELTRTINGLRKDAKLTISDFVSLEYNTDDEQISRVFEKYTEELKKSVLAKEISKTEVALDKVKINENEVGLKINKV